MVVEIKNTFFQICIVIVITLILFNLAVAWVDTLNIYQTNVDTGIATGADQNETFQNIAGINIDSIWTLVLTGTAIAGIALAWITRSTTIIGIVLFSLVFWASYWNTLSILNIGDYIPGGFILIGTAGMLFIWVGAIIGMLSGSG